MTVNTESREWWGAQAFKAAETRQWRIGPLELTAQRLHEEWRIWTRTGSSDPVDPCYRKAEIVDPPQSLPSARFHSRGDEALLTLDVRLADRSVVARPTAPFHIVSGECVRVFVSTPVWVALGVTTPKLDLYEVPCIRPSDTWVGPSTQQGELAYAVRTNCRLRLSDLPLRPHRATTPVEIENRARDSLLLERLVVPVPSLATFAGRDARLWTPAIKLRRDDPGAELASLEIEGAAPAEADGAQRLAEPRKPRESGSLFRAFASML